MTHTHPGFATCELSSPVVEGDLSAQQGTAPDNGMRPLTNARYYRAVRTNGLSIHCFDQQVIQPQPDPASDHEWARAQQHATMYTWQ